MTINKKFLLYSAPSTKEHTIHYRASTEQVELFKQDIAYGFRTVKPFLKKWIQVPDNYDEMYQQALHEMQQPDFEATGTLLTVWGTIPRRNNDPQFLIVP